MCFSVWKAETSVAGKVYCKACMLHEVTQHKLTRKRRGRVAPVDSTVHLCITDDFLAPSHGSCVCRARLRSHDVCAAQAVFRCLMRWDHWLEMMLPAAHMLQDIFPGLVVDYRRHHTHARRLCLGLNVSMCSCIAKVLGAIQDRRILHMPCL
eukprot:6191639-Pleurochrysis_carterae.AAC.3